MATNLLLISGAESGIWGIFDDVAELPNVSGAAIQNGGLKVGHLALCNLATVVALKVCTLATVGAATWADLAHAGGTLTGDLTLTGTLSAEQVTSSDDASVVDDLAVTGLLTVGETANVVGDFSVATSQLTVAAATGNTAIAGTLTVTGAVTASALTATRIPYAGAAGLIKDEAALTYTEASDLLTCGALTVSTGALNVSAGATQVEALGVDGDFDVGTTMLTVAAASGNTAIAGTLDVTGATTLTGGLALSAGATIQQWNHAGAGALASRGTDGTSVSGTVNYVGWTPDANMTVTNVNVLQGTTVGTNKVIVSIYTVAGVLLQSSALAGITTSGADTYLQCPLIATLAVLQGTEYLVGISLDGATDGMQRAPAGHRVGTGRAGTQAGVFGTLDAISSPATAFAADTAPLFFVN